MRSNGNKLHINGFHTIRDVQRYQEHQIWSSNEEVMQVSIHEDVRRCRRNFSSLEQVATSREGVFGMSTVTATIGRGKPNLFHVILGGTLREVINRRSS